MAEQQTQGDPLLAPPLTEAAIGVQLAPVRDFVMRHGLDSALSISLSLVRELFDVAAPIAITLEHDPDAREEWLAVRALARGSVDRVLEAQDAYARRWVRSVPLNTSPKVRLDVGVA